MKDDKESLMSNLDISSGEPTVGDLERMIESIERGESRSVRTERSGASTTFDFPEHLKRPGWDYQWWPFKVLSEEVDASVMVEYAMGGWIPVPASHFPPLVPAGWKKPVIERQGCRAYMRPMRLTKEAQLEAQKHAIERRDSRLESAAVGDAGREFAPRDPRAGGISAEIKPLM